MNTPTPPPVVTEADQIFASKLLEHLHLVYPGERRMLLLNAIARNRIASTEALIAERDAAKAAVKDAYREGFYDADEGQGTEDELYREFEACWEISRAKAALETHHGE